MQSRADDLGAAQRAHWQAAYRQHPRMYGREPSAPAVYAADLFASAAAGRVLELGCGHGRDALYFARRGFAVTAADFSLTALQQLSADARAAGLAGRLAVLAHDVRDPLPLADACVDAVFAHMLLCMALSTAQIQALVGEVRRVLAPGGPFVYTARHTGDAHYGAATAHGDDIFENAGFAVHYFSPALVQRLAEGWQSMEVAAFEEGELPRRLWRVTQRKPSDPWRGKEAP
jgi:SAM-dependent methyltransferase